jgi:uncharacterized protein
METAKQLKNLTFLIKPASSSCNLCCRYCFYADVAKNREIANLGMMSSKIMRTLIQSAFRSIDSCGQISFAFQGGEPTLAGLDFFKEFIEVVNAYRISGVQVTYSIQTNGLAIQEDWAAFFRENNFLVGLSIDGDKSTHDFREC